MNARFEFFLEAYRSNWAPAPVEYTYVAIKLILLPLKHSFNIAQ